MSASMQIKIGIIGGSGLDDPDILEGRTEKYVDTPYGKPSDALIMGKIQNVECVLLARHGRQHTIMPTDVNYQANIWALREEGCTHLLVTTACGSLREEIQPGDIVIIDQFIDRTTKRAQTLYDGRPTSPPGVSHIPMAEPFCTRTREVLLEVARGLGVKCHPQGTVLTIEGPRFSSRAESLMFRQWGADVINMTSVPEVVLAKEAGLCYASIAMATDYDCWKEHEEAVFKAVSRHLSPYSEGLRRQRPEDYEGECQQGQQYPAHCYPPDLHPGGLDPHHKSSEDNSPILNNATKATPRTTEKPLSTPVYQRMTCNTPATNTNNGFISLDSSSVNHKKVPDMHVFSTVHLPGFHNTFE
ncbi:S-methyl-5'-thioadenosine phosphorylase isoform X1 [Salmo salar]|uniref:Purine nucleoside phosphorylase n=1 Tax=Salmo salar TaxID=8030 RepID=A0A1S3SL75_SALSA|nr:S-methyl-5'-thioadenosine phosphorylase isoform X1 [Salmo salar]|eukprot:XP_014065091.1 PREDICTED: S-methyl-5'-thioadenosine phosphorylase isoform X1 [Salmo salar]